MKLKSFNYILGLLIIFFYSPLFSEEKIDIWNNKKKIIEESQKKESGDAQERLSIEPSQPIQALKKIEITEDTPIQTDEQKVYGIYEPATSYEGIKQYTMYLIYPTMAEVGGGAISPVDGGLTNLWVFVWALVGSGLVTILGSLALNQSDIQEE